MQSWFEQVVWEKQTGTASTARLIASASWVLDASRAGTGAALVHRAAAPAAAAAATSVATATAATDASKSSTASTRTAACAGDVADHL